MPTRVKNRYFSCLVWFQSANSQEDQRDSSFIRFVPGQERWSGELQTAIVSYQNNFGVTVNLVSAVHLADVDYYAALTIISKSRCCVI